MMVNTLQKSTFSEDVSEEPSVLVLAENAVDFKYAQITKGLPIRYEHVNIFRFMDLLYSCNLKAKNISYEKVYFHVRYLKWRGYFFTIPFYVAVIIGCWFSGICLTWTCHNIWEHEFKSKFQNMLLRRLVAWAADDVIVMHEGLVKYLPRRAQSKVEAASFGDFKKDFQARTDTNSEFERVLRDWGHGENIRPIDLLFVSGTFEDFDVLKAVVQGLEEHTALAVATKHSECEVGSNYLIYNQFVSAEMHEMLSVDGPLVGLIVHNNISVPTSLYVFASYGIPVLALDAEPMNEVVSEWELGLTFQSPNEVEGKLEQIQERYEYFSENARQFLTANNWDHSRSIHEDIWCS